MWRFKELLANYACFQTVAIQYAQALILLSPAIESFFDFAILAEKNDRMMAIP